MHGHLWILKVSSKFNVWMNIRKDRCCVIVLYNRHLPHTQTVPEHKKCPCADHLCECPLHGDPCQWHHPIALQLSRSFRKPFLELAHVSLVQYWDIQNPQTDNSVYSCPRLRDYYTIDTERPCYRASGESYWDVATYTDSFFDSVVNLVAAKTGF